jgi:CheY-like chemotaxis protein
VRKRVLIIDDAEDVRALLECALKLERCDVRCAASRDEALPVIRDWKPDVVLLDYYMPGLTIETFLKKLIEEQYAGLPRIVLMTAGFEADKKALSLGIPEVLRKPFDPIRIFEHIAPCVA